MLVSNYYRSTAFRSNAIPEQAPIPKAKGAMDKLEHWYHNTLAIRLPWGNYANLHNFNTVGYGFAIAQHPEKNSPEKLAEKVYWNHQCLKIDQSHWIIDGLHLLTIFFADRIMCVIFSVITIIAGVLTSIKHEAFYYKFTLIVLLSIAILHLLFYYAVPIIINVITPRLMKDRGCGFFRQTGMVKKYMGADQYFEAPFTEFDVYLSNLPDMNGISRYHLDIVHRYTLTSFPFPIGGVTSEACLRFPDWDTLQRFMDVTQPLPDIPQMEPFRELDPTTAEYDKQGKRGHPKDYWAKIDPNEWDKKHSHEMNLAVLKYPWHKLEDKMAGKVPGREDEDAEVMKSWQSTRWSIKSKEQNTSVDNTSSDS